MANFTDEEIDPVQKAKVGFPQTPAVSMPPTLGSGMTGQLQVPKDLGFITGAQPGVAPPTVSPIITAESAASSVGNDMQRSGGIAGSIDMAGVNKIMERENAARQSMIDSQRTDNKPGGGVAILNDSQGDANAKWERDMANRSLASDVANAARVGGRAGNAAMAAATGLAREQMSNDVAIRGQNLSNSAAIAQQGITARGQDLNAQTDAARNQVAIRGQDIGANSDAQRLGIDRSRLELTASEQARAGEKWGIEKGIMQGQVADTEATRGARNELTAAIASGDPARVQLAKDKAVALGVKFDKPNNEFVAVTDSMGMNVTRTNKDTGAVDIINPKTGEVKSVPAPGSQKAAIPVPPGHTVVGTSNGKRVLQDATGKRFIEGGN